MSDPETATAETPTAEAPAAAVPDPAPAQPAVASPESAIQRIEEAALAALAKVEAIPADLGSKVADMEVRVHQEVDTFWANVIANVSARVETPIHNYLHDEKEALKARLSVLFHKEG